MRTYRSRLVVALAVLLGGALSLAFQGCSEATTVYGCPDPPGVPPPGYDPRCPQCDDPAGYGLDAGPGTLPGCCAGFVDVNGVFIPPASSCPPDAGADGGHASLDQDGGIMLATPSCMGACVPEPPFGWEGPGLLWLGPEDAMTTCPASAPVPYQAHAGLVAPPAAPCTACTCSLSSGACSTPEHIAASASPCAGAGPPSRDFSAPPGWDGSCTAFDSIPQGDLCNGAPCVASLTTDPLVLVENGCTPSTPTLVSAAAPSWQSAVLGCRASTPPTNMCGDPGQTCAPRAPATPNFDTCIFAKGDNDCPSSYPDKHLVYVAFADTRGCAPCTCGTPESSCSATLSVFKDGACTVPLLLNFPMSSAGAACFDLSTVPAGPALGSKTIAGVAYQAGACTPSGGDPVGAVEPTDPATFCCLVGTVQP